MCIRDRVMRAMVAVHNLKPGAAAAIAIRSEGANTWNLDKVRYTTGEQGRVSTANTARGQLCENIRGTVQCRHYRPPSALEATMQPTILYDTIATAKDSSMYRCGRMPRSAPLFANLLEIVYST